MSPTTVQRWAFGTTGFGGAFQPFSSLSAVSSLFASQPKGKQVAPRVLLLAVSHHGGLWYGARDMIDSPKGSCFIISPFREPFDEYCREIYRPAIDAAGLQPVRADEIFRPGVFMQDVYDQIASCSVALAELTGKNPNVFYELGLAHALGKPVVLVAQRKDEFPADLRSVRWIQYELARVHWAEQLRNDIAQALTVARSGAVTLPFRALAVLSPAEQLASVSGTQKSIFDHLLAQPGWTGLTDLASRFKFPKPEVYYRLHVGSVLKRSEAVPNHTKCVWMIKRMEPTRSRLSPVPVACGGCSPTH